MLKQSLTSLRERTVREFCACMEFKAFTHIAYEMATDLAKRPDVVGEITIGYDAFAKEFGIANRVVNLKEMPKDFARAKEGNFLPMIHQYQVALFEHIFFDVLRLILINHPLLLPGKRQVEYSIILKASNKDEIVSQLIDRELNEVKYKGVSDWFDYLEKANSSCKTPAEDIARIAEAKATRDILAHNAGIVNNIYLLKAGQLARAGLGESIDVRGNYTRDTWQLFFRALLRVLDQLLA